MNPPSNPTGTRDFFGSKLQKRKYLIQTLTHFFELYGFEPIETPALEYTDTLLGKYGDEGDKLLFRILDNGLHLPIQADQLSTLSSKALRYDLTIPFARFVVSHRAALTLPFKRYQIQAVWRGDRPQRGRYREFYQCDADIIGSNSLLFEIDLMHLYQECFDALCIPQVCIYLNSRKILSALVHKLRLQAQAKDFLTHLDKIDKIGSQAVLEHLKGMVTTEDAQRDLQTFFDISHLEGEEVLSALKRFFGDETLGLEGVEEIEYVYQRRLTHTSTRLRIDISLARGLHYYTGLIFEARTNAVRMGSLGGGGRYDNLTASMGLENMSGVGLSFGIDRIYDVMEELHLFPTEISSKKSLLFFYIDEKGIDKSRELARTLRSKGIACELYHQADKMDKQFKYAEKKNLDLIAMIGENELATQSLQLKNIHIKGRSTQISLSAFLSEPLTHLNQMLVPSA